jgi:transposase
MTSMPTMTSPRRVVIGVDTHKFVHAAAALDERGALVQTATFRADGRGYDELIGWAAGLGTEVTFAIEGSGSYGAGLASAVRCQGGRAIEVMRTNGYDRRRRGKSDVLDAENAARAVQAGLARYAPRDTDGQVGMIRAVKIAKDGAIKSRTVAMVSLKSVLVTAPPALREELQPLPNMALIRRCATLRPGQITTVGAAAKHTLRALARRWLALNDEITGHKKLLAHLVEELAPQLTAPVGIGPDSAAELLLIAGDNAERIHSPAAFAKLCGACPIPASSGITNRHRLNRGGHRHANAALHRIVIVRMKHHQPTKDYVARRTAEGKTKREIIRCLKNYVARETWTLTKPLHSPANTPQPIT